LPHGRLLATLLLGLFLTTALQAQSLPINVPTIPLDQIKAGMRGEAWTVFEGSQPEKMEVEVLGILRNLAGPKSDVILVRLHGARVEYTGVAAGMSGSPVYIDGKLAGALAYRIGEFSKEPIGGVTPIASMLEINDIPAQPAAPAAPSAAADTSSYLTPIATPLTLSGFTPETIRQFAPRFAESGLLAVAGAGSSQETSPNQPLAAGSAVAAVLVRGDMEMAATCTVTYADATHLLACGHPVLGSGNVQIPMARARILATLASPASPMKIATTTEEAGSFTQDRKSGILGHIGGTARMIPVAISATGGGISKQYNVEVLDNPRLTPQVLMSIIFNTLQANNLYDEQNSLRLRGSVELDGHESITLGGVYAPGDNPMPPPLALALNAGETFARLFANPQQPPVLRRVTIQVESLPGRRGAQIESARLSTLTAHPGEQISVEVTLHPWRAPAITRSLAVTIPASTPPGRLQLLVSDGATLDNPRRAAALAGSLDLDALAGFYNSLHSNDRIYVSLLQAAPQAEVAGQTLPDLPLSVLGVVDGLRASHELMLAPNTPITVASGALEYEISGAHMLTIAIR
jgi:hypothetical protein